MRLGFSETLSAALVHADDQARQYGQEFVGTEHLLLGILAGKSGDAFRALQTATNVEQVTAQVIKALPAAAERPLVTGRFPLSPKAQRCVNTAISEAQSAGQKVVSTRYLLLAMLGDTDSAIGEILSGNGADLDDLRSILSRDGENSEP